MGRHAELELDNQLCFPLYAASRSLTQAYAPLLEPFGLTYPQYLTMLALWSTDGGSTVGGIGRRLRLDSGTLTPLLKRLESAGLVQRQRDPADERRVVVTVTAAGDRLQDEVVGIPVALAKRLGLNLEEGMLLHRLLHQMIDHLDHLDQLDAGSDCADRADQSGGSDRTEATDPKAAS